MPSILDNSPVDPAIRTGHKTALLEDRVQRLELQSGTTFRAVGNAVPYSNGWRTYAGTPNDFSPVYFYRDVNGRVYIDGLADKNGASFVAYEVIFTLPDGYRPDRNLIFVSEAAGGGLFGTCQIRVNKTGVVQIGDRGGPASPVSWVSFAGINFRVN